MAYRIIGWLLLFGVWVLVSITAAHRTEEPDKRRQRKKQHSSPPPLLPSGAVKEPLDRYYLCHKN